MMLGIVANGLPAPRVAVSPYDGASVIMDFEADYYAVNGVACLASDLLEDVSNITPGVGLYVEWSVTTEIYLKAAAYNAIDIVNGWTVFADLVQTALETTTNVDGTLAHFWNENDGYPSGRRRFLMQSYDGEVSSEYQYFDDPNVSWVAGIQATALGNGQRRRIAATATPSLASVCINGASPVVDNAGTAGTPDFTKYAIAGFQGYGADFTATVARMIIYPALTEAQMSALTA